MREVATNAHDTARKILDLRDHYQKLLSKEGKAGTNLLRAFDLLFIHPVIAVGFVENELEVSPMTANTLVNKLQELGVLREMTGYKRNRRFSFDPYLALFDEPPVG